MFADFADRSGAAPLVVPFDPRPIHTRVAAFLASPATPCDNPAMANLLAVEWYAAFKEIVIPVVGTIAVPVVLFFIVLAIQKQLAAGLTVGGISK